MLDLVDRLLLAPLLYGERGVLPMEVWNTLYGDKTWSWSLHLGLVSEPLLTAMLLLQLALATCILLGLRPALAAACSWPLLVSLNHRDPLVSYGGDKLAALLLLSIALLPWGAARSARERRLAEALLTAQVAVLYITAGVTKLLEATWRDGTALDHALHLDQLVKPFGTWLTGWTELLALVTPVVPWWEILPGVMLLHPKSRGLGVLLLLPLNLGIWLCFDVGWFIPYTTAALLACSPAGWWPARMTPPTPSELAPLHRGRALLLGLLLATSVLTGVESWSGRPRLPWPTAAWTVVRSAELYQNWDVFTRLRHETSWYVAKAHLSDGRWVDLLQEGGPVDYAAPTGRNALFRSGFRWRLLMMKGASLREHPEVGRAIAATLARRWARRTRVSVEQVTLYQLVGTPGEPAHDRWHTFGEWTATGRAGDGQPP